MRSDNRGTSSVSSSSPSTPTPEPPISASTSEDKPDDVKSVCLDLIKTESDDKMIAKLEDVGKDIDLKQIESEMKGLDKPMKKEDDRSLKDTLPRIVSLVVPASLNMLDKKHTGTDVLVKRIGSESPLKRVEIQVKTVNPHDQLSKQMMTQKRENKGFDIYEFKEPEPFELGEIRRKDGKTKSGGSNLSDEGEQEVMKVRRKGRPKKEGRDDSDKSESDSDTSVSPQKKMSLSKETPVKRLDASDIMSSDLISPDKKEIPESLMTPKKSTIKGESSRQDTQSPIHMEIPRTPGSKISAIDIKSTTPNKDHTKILPSPNKSKSERQLPGTVSPQVRLVGANIRPGTPVRHQNPGNYHPSSPQGLVRYQGPVTYPGPGSPQNIAKPVTLKTKNPNPQTYPGSAVLRNLSTSLSISTTVANLSHVGAPHSSPKSVSPRSTSQGNLEIPLSQSPPPPVLAQPRVVQANISSISTVPTTSYITTISQQTRISSPNSNIASYVGKPKLSVQTVQANRVPQSLPNRPLSSVVQAAITPNSLNVPTSTNIAFTQSVVISQTGSNNTSQVTSDITATVSTNTKSGLLNRSNSPLSTVQQISSSQSNSVKNKSQYESGSSSQMSNPTGTLGTSNTQVTAASQANPVIHLLAQVVMPPKESKALAKPVSKVNIDNKLDKNASSSSNQKIDDKNDPKVIPFSQRQQIIFPHLLNRPESSEKIKDIQLKIPNPGLASGTLSLPATSQSLPEPPTLTETSLPENSETERLLQEASVEESIEAVVQRAREDQSSNDAQELNKPESKGSERRRRSSNRTKKVLSREFVPDTSEESDSDSKPSSIEMEKRIKRSKNADEDQNKSIKKSKPSEHDNHPRRKSSDDISTHAENDGSRVPNPQSTAKDIKIDSSLQSDVHGQAKRESEISEKESRFPRKKLRSCATPKRLEDEVETGLGDLLCEETIPPGSPMAQESNLGESDASNRPDVKHEMPFASVPTGSSFGKRGPNNNGQEQQRLLVQTPHQMKSSVPAQQMSSQFGVCENNQLNTNNKNSTVESCLNKQSSSQMNQVQNKEQTHQFMQLGNEGIKCSRQNEGNKTPRQNEENMRQSNKNDSTPLSSSTSNTMVIDNTPPTTPESIVSNISDSPSRDNDAGKIDDTSKSGQDSSEMEMENLGDRNKIEQFSEDSNTMDSNIGSDSQPRGRGRPSNSKRGVQSSSGGCSNSSINANTSGATAGDSEHWDADESSHTSSSTKRRKRGPRARANEDDDDSRKSHTSSNPTPTRRRRRYSSSRGGKEEECDNSGLSTLSMAACGMSARSKYNFCQEIGKSILNLSFNL